MARSQKRPQREPPGGTIRVKVICERNKDMRLIRQVPLARQQMHRGAAWLQNPEYLLEILIGVPRVFQHRCAQHDMEALVVEWQSIRIGPDLFAALRHRRGALPLRSCNDIASVSIIT